ncbi:MAG: hypothetical protein R3Y47_12175 [Lachnospiraceae bacterium]
MQHTLSPLRRWQDRTVMGDNVIEIPIDYGNVTEEKVKSMRAFIRKNNNLYLPTYVVMYHSTAKSIPILEQGLKPTTYHRRRSYQSESGYVYLANTPERAKMYGDLGNMSHTTIYEVIVPIRTLLADKDLLMNQRSVGVSVGNTLAESLCYGGARVKGNIEPWQIKEYIPEEVEKVGEIMATEVTNHLLELLEQKIGSMGYEIKERDGNERYGSLKDIYLDDEKVAVFLPNGLGFPQIPHLQEEQTKLTDFFNRFREMYYLYEHGEPLPFDSITDYHIASAFGQSILAVKLNKNHDFCFTTWDYDYERKGVCYGHYFETNYEGAKLDFLYRSGLLDESKELKQEERAMIYDCLVYRGINDNDISFDDDQLLNKVIEKFEEALPEPISEEREQEMER